MQEAGVSACLLKRSTPEEVLSCLEAAFAPQATTLRIEALDKEGRFSCAAEQPPTSGCRKI